MNAQNIEAVVEGLTKTLNIKVTKQTVRNCLNEHPKYQSLLSINNCLTEWRVKNYGHKIDKNEFNPNKIKFPFIAYLAGKFALIHDEVTETLYIQMKLLKKKRFHYQYF